MMLFLLLFFPLTAFVQVAFGTIIPAPSVEMIKSVLEKAEPGDLVVVDVDCTLMIPHDKVLRPCGEEFFLEQFTSYAPYLSEARINFLGSKILLDRAVELTEPGFPELVASLQARQIPVIALTALLTGSFGAISCMEEWREKELKKLGFDFSSAFSKYNHIIFGDIKREGSVPVFKNGILFCSRHSKGEMLEGLLRRVKFQPKRVICIDDSLSHLFSVEKAMAIREVECLCLHYCAVEELADRLDETLAYKQFHHLLLHDTWLSDCAFLSK